MAKETDLYEQLAQYMKLQHRDVLYHFDLSGVWTPSHHSRNLYGRLNARAWPDLFIARTSLFDGTVNPCAGLFLELKRDGTRLKRRDGRWTNEHIEEQAAVLDHLRDQGYYAEFAVGFDQAKQYIDEYLGHALQSCSSMDTETF